MTMENNSDFTPFGGSKGKFTGYHMIACMVAFFSVIMFANFTMAWYASSSWTGLVVKNSYVASQNFNEKLQAARLQNARGWNSTFSYSNNLIGLQILGREDRPVDFQKMTISFFSSGFSK